MALNNKIFILGVGCQKGGTSWLNHYLRLHPSSQLGIMKEYHVFDALYVPECSNWYLNAVKNAKTDRNSKLRARFIEDSQAYFDYFTHLLEKSGKQFTADITPSYAALPEHALHAIKDGFEKRGVTVKVVFLMRDPFERVFSYCRKDIRNRKLSYKENPYLEQESLLKHFATRGCEFRTQYEITIKKLENVFDSKDIFYGFYETLFTDESIKRLTDFLGVDFSKGNYMEKVNEGQAPQKFDTLAYEKIISNHYRDTYLFLYDRFGESFIKNIWKSARHISKL
ncbi:hypothetical protein SANA_28570 [Gottschalkiaceae bacterium SANA]|nr:hypothetical protein SANA_28570 [Gottschalkiaceae bacterium SANA]